MSDMTVSTPLLMEILDTLRLAHVYALKDSHPEELPEDFKPWKWDGCEISFARKASEQHRKLLDELLPQSARG
jgi:hypothetical protein